MAAPDALRRFGLDETRWIDRDRVDLRGFLTARLEHLGLRTTAIASVGGCTVESPALASHRRDGHAAGRQWAMVVLSGNEQPRNLTGLSSSALSADRRQR